MLPLPWQSKSAADPGREYVALLSYLPLNSYRMIPRFLMYTQQTRGQLASAPGLIGYSVMAQILDRRFWTLSAWADRQSLMSFVQQAPHGRIMQTLSPHMGKTQFVQWTVKGSDLPLAWKQALDRIRPS